MSKIALLVIATGKYIEFIGPLWYSAQKHFLIKHDVRMFLFTNNLHYKTDNKQILIPQRHLTWPHPTLFRYNIFNQSRPLLEKADYIYYCDADMLFVDDVGDEVLGERVATLHPGFYKSPRAEFTYESNPLSLAYIPSHEGTHYYAGGFNGGTAGEYLKLCKILSQRILDDYKRGIIAKWHDESHMNRYFIDNPPTVILSPSYCHPESWRLDIEKKLLALDKNHKAMRS